MIFSEPLVRLFADGYDAETTALAVSLTRLMFPTSCSRHCLFLCGILQSFEEFTYRRSSASCRTASFPVFLSVQRPIRHLRTGRRVPHRLVCADGCSGAVAAQKRVCLSSVFQAARRRDEKSIRPDGARHDQHLGAADQPTINSKFGSRLFDGSGVSAIELSYNLYTIIVGVFVLSVTNVIFPRLSRLTAGNEQELFRKTISRTSGRRCILSHHDGGAHGPVGAARFAHLRRRRIRCVFRVHYVPGAPLHFSGHGGFRLQAILCRAYFAEQNGRIPSSPA